MSLFNDKVAKLLAGHEALLLLHFLSCRTIC